MPKAPDKFTRREVERAFRKFRDLIDDLDSTPHQTWGEAFGRLIAHCETDAVMQVITGPLATDPRVDANKWWADALTSTRGMAGTGHFALPTDDDERTALLYQVLLKIEHEDVEISRFCDVVYGLTRYQDMADTFNREIVSKFTREVAYRLDEIAADTAGQTEITREATLPAKIAETLTAPAISVEGGEVSGH